MSLRSSRTLPRLLLARLGAATVASSALFAAQDAAATNPKWPLPADATSATAKDPTYWPDDPGWAYQPGKLPKDRVKGDWDYFGFEPDRSPGYENGTPKGLRPAEQGKPSGMSVDLAWRITTGDPRVVIAVADSGPKWESGDLLNKWFLNRGELKTHLPKHADGSACGGTGDLAGFDCNGDGALNVRDYADDPDLKPAAHTDGAGTMHPAGDANDNGVLDPGDLILNFSDGVDDDQNGYLDDISGWDFFMDDNDPYEDTRFYHGTLMANTAAAETNNGMDNVGVCPDCQVVHVRVSDSFIADAQAFGKAIMYATDIGAKVVQCALGTINNSAFTSAAIEYAYDHGVLVSGSMADENSKHHNQPNTTNYVMQSHAIVNNGQDTNATTSRSNLCFDPGTNYGGQQQLSASTEGASSTASAVGSGATGMLQSAALKFGSAPLSPNEVMQLLTMTADDVDVPESQDPKSQYYWSQTGWDQRFGYGRVNLSTAVEWVRDGKIPPEVNITEPTWFANLYPDRTPTVDVVGSISAKRATSYDYVVEWGPGVQPLEKDFQQLASVTNVAGTTVTGSATSPIVTIDLSKIDPKHDRDPDSLPVYPGAPGANDEAFTLRVRATAHYGGQIGDVPGSYRRTYYKRSDPSLLPGFPIRLGSSGESSPKIVDLDGDGKNELVHASAGGLIHVWDASGGMPVDVPGFPFKAKKLEGLDGAPLSSNAKNPGYLNAKAYAGFDLDVARESFFATVAVGDVDGDGKKEIAATTFEGSIYLVEPDGSVRPGFPVRLPYVPSCPLDPTVMRPAECMDTKNLIVRGAGASPVLVDMNGDGKLDIVQPGYDGKIYVFDASGNPVPGWPVALHFSDPQGGDFEHNRIITTPAVADVNGDGLPEVLCGSSEKIGGDEGSGAFYLVDGRGNAAPGGPYLPHWPISVTSLHVLPMVGEGVSTSGLFADVDGDGTPEVIFHGNGSTPLILPIDPGTQSFLDATPSNALPKYTDSKGMPQQGIQPTSIFGDDSMARSPDTMFPLFASPSAGDLDMDGTLDVVAAGGSLSLLANLTSKGKSTTMPAQFLVGAWSSKTGAMLPGSPYPIEDFMFVNNQVIADLNGDGYPEVVTGSGGYLVHAYDACGREPAGWPKNTGQWVFATVALGDLDGDGKLEAAVSTRDGWMYAWHTEGRTDGVVQWASFHHDDRNTGNVATPLPFGVTRSSAPPLDCGAPAAGGSGGAAGAGGGSGGPMGGPGPDEPTSHELEPSGGCGCTTTNSPANYGFALLGAATLLETLRRRRARR